MKLLFVIADYAKADKLKKSGDDAEFPVPYALFAHGHGSADSRVLELVGLGDNKKIVAIIPLADDKVKNAYKHLDRVLNLKREGIGIAFTVPMSVVGRAFAKFIVGDNIEMAQPTVRISESEEIARAPFELIITIVEAGHAEDVRDAAHSIGARGGTFMHGFGMANDEVGKFFNITTQPERDVVLIVAAKRDVRPIMQEIAKKAGVNTAGHGVCFSVPVDSALGLATKSDETEDE